MNLLYLSPTGALGGAEKVLLSVLKGVRQARPDARLTLLSFADGPLVDQAGQLGVNTAILPLPDALAKLGDSRLAGAPDRPAAVSVLWRMLAGSTAGWRFLSDLRHQVRRIAPDLIHSNGIKTHGLIALAHDGKAPIIWHVHDFLGARPLASRLLRLASCQVHAAVAVSSAVAADLHAMGLGERTRVIANAVDVDQYFPAMQDPALLDELAAMSAAPPGCLRVGLVATYARWKGHDIFLEAAARLTCARPQMPIRFYVVGGPIYQTPGSQFDQNELLARASAQGIADRVGFIDFQANVAPIYRALDVVVQASTAPEPFGLTIIEAMACGKVVVASLAGGVADIIRPGHDALAVKPGDGAQLAAALETVLDDPQLRRQLEAHARQTVCQKFAQGRVGPQFVDLYDSVAGVREASSWHAQRNFIPA